MARIEFLQSLSLLRRAPSPNTPPLDVFRASEQQKLLDDIDDLRHRGLSEFIFLPQIVVCGDQSSGKSSVLEAISGIPFPRHDTLCTRFVTEVVLRQAETSGAAVSIVPSKDASDSDRTRLLAFKESLQGLEGFPRLVDQAKSAMGLSTAGRAFSKDILRVEISGPDKPKLTLVDLPGLIHSESRQQSDADVQLIFDLVQSYMRNPRSVNLAVVSAKNDYANQIILKLARQVDPEGLRTLGLITKPDTLDRDSDSEATFLDLASNSNIYFRLGWHVVKNRDFESRNCTAEERDKSEERFFSEGVWKELSPNMVGVKSLRHRLGGILLQQIKTHLPSLMKDIESSIQDCRGKLLKLGDSRDTPEKRRQFLLKLSQSFQTICRAAINGNYDHQFFSGPSSADEDCKRLRAVVRSLHREFSELMWKKGHHRTIVDDREESADTVEAAPDEPQPLVLSRAKAIDWVKEKLLKSRGCELPGSYNPLLVGEFFREQSDRWGDIAHRHIRRTWLASREFLEKLLGTITDDETSRLLFTHWIDPNMDRQLDTANRALRRLLQELEGHPITYDDSYIERLGESRKQRHTKELQGGIQRFIDNRSDSLRGEHIIRELAQALATPTEKDMDAFACSEILDSMQAYYKVALNRFIDNVAIQVVERSLIKDMCSLFFPSDVGTMSPEHIARIATESMESQALRQQLDRKLHSLENGMETCQQHFIHRSVETIRASIKVKAALQDDEKESQCGSFSGDWPEVTPASEGGAPNIVKESPRVSAPKSTVEEGIGEGKSMDLTPRLSEKA